MSQALGTIDSGTEVALDGDITRLSEWNPPSLMLYYVSSGVIISVTADVVGYMFVFDAASDDSLLFELPLYDYTSELEYDGSNLELYLEYFIPTGSTIAAKNYKIFMAYSFVSDGDDMNNSSPTFANKTITLTGKTADELQTELILTLGGTSGSKILKLGVQRDSSGGGSDTFAGDLNGIAITMKLA